jgi:hypothetical protein
MVNVQTIRGSKTMWESTKVKVPNEEPTAGTWNMRENTDGKMRPQFCCPDCHITHWLKLDTIDNAGNINEFICDNQSAGCIFKASPLHLKEWPSE